MATATPTLPTTHDYSLVGPTTKQAIERGLAEAKWYASPIPKAQMRELLERRDGPAIRDTILWFSLLIGAGLAGYFTWGTPWAVLAFAIFGGIYGASGDSRWHECGHGTAFKTDWMNDVVYEIASFMILRESTFWRWSHTRHHSDTIIVGRDPEIAVQRPTNMREFVLNFFSIGTYKKFFTGIVRHSFGRLAPDEATFIPEFARPGVYARARIYVAIYVITIAAAIYFGSLLPLMYIGLPMFYGSWLMVTYGYTQHAGLAENVLDHRLNCRTVYMNPVHRFLYWNMNYHVEHHMFPLVPYHNLPKLHAAIKTDCPTPYDGILVAWRELFAAVWRQRRDPGFFVKRVLPTPTHRNEAPATAEVFTAEGRAPVDGWIDAVPAALIQKEDVLRFDHDGRTYALYRTADNKYYASSGICTHGNAHLADGMVKGNLIECPKHNGRFDIRDGSPARLPVCVAMRTFDVQVRGGRVWLQLAPQVQAEEQRFELRVVSNDNVATFIKELVLEPAAGSTLPEYQPGDYLQLEIPPYARRTLESVQVGAKYEPVWKRAHVFEYASSNAMATRRNYSLATNPATDRQLRFNVRIATPPQGQECEAGVGSTWVFGLKQGDRVTAYGPFGTFRIKQTDREMVYLGGGAGMAPLRSHLANLLETQGSARKISFWYGARSLQEMFYQDYFAGLAGRFPNFTFHTALSEPQADETWTGQTGFVHDVLLREYLSTHPDPKSVEYYLCGPPAMMKAAREMLAGLGVGEEQIACDEF
jgi:Na(+)-translocating NADH:ubiquinone oxidoreductase F subunit